MDELRQLIRTLLLANRQRDDRYRAYQDALAASERAERDVRRAARRMGVDDATLNDMAREMRKADRLTPAR